MSRDLIVSARAAQCRVFERFFNPREFSFSSIEDHIDQMLRLIQIGKGLSF